ncbi:flavin-dependent oxidoreductase, partial [Aliidiomarina maris]
YMLFTIPAGAGRSRPEDIPEHFLSQWQHIENTEYMHSAVQRSYSMATAAGGKELVFTVRYQPQATDAPSPGIGSSFLCNLKPGEIIAAEGPFGDFQRQPGAQRKLCFIGGGAGMAPLRALMQEELNDTASRPIIFFYGARNRHELLYYDEFMQHQQRGELTFIPVLSKPEKACLWQQDVGFVHEIAGKWLQSQSVDAYDFYLCGPPSMLSATLTMLKEHGVDETRIRYDDFGS